MFIEQPPSLYRWLFAGAIWRIPSKIKGEKHIYLTFDDGPIPEVTPWVLDILDSREVKATFFCVGENVMKYPEIYNAILSKGHRVGNHTFNHIQGIKVSTKKYLKNTTIAAQNINSDLFRPPHGHMRRSQFCALKKKYKIIYWDVVTRDYSKYMTPQKIVCALKQFARDGSIIVFHDSIKSQENLKQVLPQAVDWLKTEGYLFKVIP